MSAHNARVKTNSGIYVERPVCCQQLAQAFQLGGDYGPLAYNWNFSPTSIYLGSDMPRIHFCPWCGTSLDLLPKWEMP